MSWVFKKLGDLLKIQNGYAFDSKLFSSDGEMPLIRIRDIKKGIDTEIRYTGEYDSKYVVKSGDLLIGMDGEFGCYEWKGSDGLLNQRVCRLQNFESQIYPRFLLYGINSYLKAIEDVTGYTTVKHLSSKQIANIEFPLPPLSIQKKIVAKLDAIFFEIDKAATVAEANAKNAGALFQNYLDKLFAEDEVLYKKVNIKDVCTIGDGNHSSKYPKKEEMVESGVPFIRGTNIVNGILCDKDLVYLTKDKHMELKKGHLKTGDVLITNRGEIGKVAIVDERFDNANLNSQIVWMRCNSELINQYLLFFLMSANMRNFYDDTKTGAALQQLPIGKIEKIKIPLPNLNVQKTRCSEFLNLQQKCSSAIFSYKNKAIQLSQLKQSLIIQAFNGELVKN